MNFGLPTPSIGGGLSLVRVLGSVSRTIGVIRQFAPLYRDMKPLVQKIPNFVNRLNYIRGIPREFQNSIAQINAPTVPVSEKATNPTSSGPVFFQ